MAPRQLSCKSVITFLCGGAYILPQAIDSVRLEMFKPKTDFRLSAIAVSLLMENQAWLRVYGMHICIGRGSSPLSASIVETPRPRVVLMRNRRKQWLRVCRYLASLYEMLEYLRPLLFIVAVLQTVTLLNVFHRYLFGAI